MEIITDASDLTTSRNFNYGDGCFTTIRVSNGYPEFLGEHIKRLQDDTACLGIDFSLWDQLIKALEEVSAKQPKSVVKILISRGFGGRGYDPAAVINPTAYITSHPMPQLSASPLSLAVANGYLSSQPLFAGAKHCNRLENVMFKQQANAIGVDDVICLDQSQHIVETSSANLFWYSKGQWHTPKIKNSGVSGVLRKQLIACFDQHKIPYKVGHYKIVDLLNADTVIVCNAVRHILPVAKIKLSTSNHATSDIPNEKDTLCPANQQFSSLQKKWDEYLSTMHQW